MNAPLKERLAIEDKAQRFAALLRSEDEDGIDLREVLRKLWRRKNLVLGTIVTLTVLAAVIVLQVTPRYTASAFVMIDPRENRVVDIEAVVSGLSTDVEAIQSEIQVIRSRGLAAKVIDRLGLDRLPEFNENLREPGGLEQLLSPAADDGDDGTALKAEWAGFLTRLRNAVLGEPVDPAPGEQARRERAKVIDHFLERLRVRPEGRSRVIRLSFESENAELAARVVNTTADLYIVEQLEAKFEATQRATEWLNQRVGDLRAKVEASERAVELYRAEQGLTESRGVTVTSQRISELNSQLTIAASEVAEAQARVDQIEQALAGARSFEAVSEVLNSRLIQDLRVQQAAVERRAAELSSELGERHPRMIQLRAEADNIRGKIAAEVNKVAQALRNEVAVARAREATLRQQLAALETEAGELGAAQVQLRALEREANANRLLMETFLNRFKETTSQEDIQQADARIISRADRPEAASFPKKKLIVALAFVASAMLGLLLAFAVEQLDHGFRSMEQIERWTGVAGLGLVPALRGIRKLGRRPEQEVVDRPVSAYTESIRTLRTGLMLADVDRSPKVVLFTSALPGEGKTSLSLSLARLAAQTGETVVFLDTDLRKPRAHRALDLPGAPGLVEVLAGEVSLDEAIAADAATGLAFLGAGRGAPNPPDLLNSDHMRALIEELTGRYDLVVLDSSPLVAVSDARILARYADKTAFVVRWADTRREVVMNAMKQLLKADADLAGVVLSQVNVKSHARYGYGDSGYYYGRTNRYYADR